MKLSWHFTFTTSGWSHHLGCHITPTGAPKTQEQQFQTVVFSQTIIHIITRFRTRSTTMWPRSSINPLLPCQGDIESTAGNTPSGPSPIHGVRRFMTEGYPLLSKWMASEDDFMVLRRFGALNTRVLLLLQNDIAKAERALFAIDEEAKGLSEEKGRCDSISDDGNQARRTKLKALVPMLEQYSKLIPNG